MKQTVDSKVYFNVFNISMKKSLFSTFLASVLLITNSAGVFAATTTNYDQNSFQTIWDGYGYAGWENNGLFLSPKAAIQSSETHSALVLNTKSLRQPYKIHARLTTTAQLRAGSTPNPWEVGWFVIGYKSDGKFTYALLKPEGYGVEIGESLLNNAQHFMWTSPVGAMNFPVGQSYDVDITAQNNTLTIVSNGVSLVNYKLTSNDVINLNGRFGFYSEDAAVQILDIRVTQGY